MSILLGTVFAHYDAAERIIKRYDLTGAGATAVRSLFSSTEGTSATFGIVGVVFLMISVLSFTRAAQRLFEQAWELKPLSVRNTRNGSWWILAFGGYAVVIALLSALPGGYALDLVALVSKAVVTAAFLVLSGWILSAKRIGWPALLPFGVTGAALTAAYSVGATLYLPHLFNSSATRYGVVGAVFAMISALFAVMLALVASAALGREVRDELSRIRDGRRPGDREVRRQWANVVEQTRSRWRTAREEISHHQIKGSDR
ncbi:hypothetical protein [Streptomyces actinomycinicus]|uniref:hypothetical protein n=1 Tax=Streptomyces actinomycinicus TaxID=1695166 RepID=UPI001F17E7F2|nr:hypothetical protein [Streptomyces actinomycinicus]